MGLQLRDLVEGKEIELKDLAGKKIAIDTYNILYQFLSSIRSPDGSLLTDSQGHVTSHLMGLFSRTTHLMQHNIQLIFVFDGKPPALKRQEQERRRQIKEEAAEAYETAKEAEDIEAMKKFASRTARLTPEMLADAKELITALGLPIVQAASEGEAQVAYLVKQGDADYGSSQDYDTLLYGIPRLIRNLSIAGKRKKAGTHSYETVKPQLIQTADVLNALQIDREQLIVLAVLIGTDYNRQGIPGIGPKKALKLLHEHKKDFAALFAAAEWEKHYSFSWKEIYNVFQDMPVTKEYDVRFTSFDSQKIIHLLCDTRGFSRERVTSTLEKLELLHTSKKQKGLGDFF
ncbi:flap endonuclease-1 [Candidatus Woesearchaeota archaeon]|nr:flap endonuclease-1 [Candidatus Woesearchaeota archaeon]